MGNWQLVYETDGSGSIIAGSLSRLGRAVRRAADIKVVYNPAGSNWWSRYCASVNIRGQDSPALVAATYMEAADTQQVPQGIDFNAPLAIEYHIYNSSGQRKVVKVDRTTGRVIDTISGVIPIRWYARNYNLSWWEIFLDSLSGLLGSNPPRPG